MPDLNLVYELRRGSLTYSDLFIVLDLISVDTLIGDTLASSSNLLFGGSRLDLRIVFGKLLT